jgi:DNA-directed RNA polymerase specialized sigma24 family protein
MPTRTRAATAAVFHDCLPSIRNVIRHARRKYRPDPDDLESEANWAFLKSLDKYDGDVPLEVFVPVYVWRRIQDWVRLEARRNRQLPRVPLPRDLPERNWGFDPTEFVARLSPDAALAAGLALGTDPDTPDPAKAVRAALRGLGWGRSRVAEAFREVREALSRG